MTQILHIIGPQGIGKSTLARVIANGYRSRGLPCNNLTEMGLHEPGFNTQLAQFRQQHLNDVLIAEHLETPDPEQLAPGDLIIRMERVQ